MITANAITLTTWLVWALIGFIGGFMLGRARQRGSMFTLLNVIVGVAFAVGGGWACCYLFGASEEMQYLSLVAAVVTTAIGLWLLSLLTKRGEPMQ